MIYYSYGDRAKPEIALTFDDGPNPPITYYLLDILDDLGIKANFFLLGHLALKYPQAVIEIRDRGHLIGAHGYIHHRKERPDFALDARILQDIMGEKPKFYRPPYGNLKLCQGSPVFSQKDNKIILWDVDPQDWKFLSVDILYQKIKKAVQNGSIIDLHDGSQHYEERGVRPFYMLEVLPRIIQELHSQGFIFKRLDEMKLVPLKF